MFDHADREKQCNTIEHTQSLKETNNLVTITQSDQDTI